MERVILVNGGRKGFTQNRPDLSGMYKPPFDLTGCILIRHSREAFYFRRVISSLDGCPGSVRIQVSFSIPPFLVKVHRFKTEPGE
jgi:hypothetical protein